MTTSDIVDFEGLGGARGFGDHLSRWGANPNNVGWSRRLGAAQTPKPYKFIGLGAMDVTKPYKFTGFGAMDVTKPYELMPRHRPNTQNRRFQDNKEYHKISLSGERFGDRRFWGVRAAPRDLTALQKGGGLRPPHLFGGL